MDCNRGSILGRSEEFERGVAPMSTVAHDLRRSFFAAATIAVLVVLQSLRVASAEPLAPSEPPNVGDAKFAAIAYYKSGAYERDLAAVASGSAPGWRSARRKSAGRPWCWISTTRCCRTGRSSWRMTSAACSRAHAGLCPMVHVDGLRGTCAQGPLQSGKCLRFSSKRVRWALRCSSFPAGMSGNAPQPSKIFVRWVLPAIGDFTWKRTAPVTHPPPTSRRRVREQDRKRRVHDHCQCR